MATKTNDVKVRIVRDLEIKGKSVKKGTAVRIGDIIGDDGTWDIERKGKVVATAIKHRAVQELAEAVGVTVKEEKILSYPSLENRMHTMWQYEVELKVLNDKGEETGEVKSAKEIGVGTADDNAGTEYMARKRAFDRAVLDVLSLFDVYSDIEAEQFKDGNSDQPLKLEDLDAKERGKINEFVKSINATTDLDSLRTLGDTLATELAQAEVSPNGVSVIRDLYQERMALIKRTEEIKDMNRGV